MASNTFDRFTDNARKVLEFARIQAERFNHNYIGTEHLLLGLIKLGKGRAIHILETLGIQNIDSVRIETEIMLRPETEVVTGPIPYTPRAKKVLELAIDEASSLNQSVGTEHLLLALLREDLGVAAQVLKEFGIVVEKIKGAMMKSSTSPSPHHEAIERLKKVRAEKMQACGLPEETWGIRFLFYGKHAGKEYLLDGTLFKAHLVDNKLFVNIGVTGIEELDVINMEPSEETSGIWVLNCRNYYTREKMRIPGIISF